MHPSDAPLPSLDLSVFRGIFEAYPDGMLLVDMDGTIVLANSAVANLLGYGTQQLLGMSVDALVPLAVGARHAGLRHGYSKAPRARPMGGDIELMARRADGNEVMVEIALSPVQSGGASLVVAALRGIGEYPRVQRALQRSRYSECIAHAARLAVDQRDPNRLIAAVAALAGKALDSEALTVWLLEPNRLEFRAASSYHSDSAARPAVQATVPNRPDTLPGLVAASGETLTVSSFASENRFNVPAAQRQGSAQSALAVPLVDAGRVIGVLVAAAGSARRFGDDEKHFVESLANLIVTAMQRAQTEAQLSHSQRLDAVGRLTGGIAHDFNNLLTIMQGNLQMLSDHPAVVGEPLLAQMAAAATHAGQRAAELTGKLLAFSRRQALASEPVELGALFRSIAAMLERTLSERIRIRVDAGGECPPCLADTAQLESALLNLALNSRDAMPDGGTLTLSCARCAEVPAALRNAAAEGTHFVAITVADTGFGMPPQILERAVEPFFTTKGPGKGTGLGLSTAYGFVKQSGGHLQIESAPGEGTRIVMVLPCVDTAGPRGGAASAASETSAGAQHAGSAADSARAGGRVTGSSERASSLHEPEIGTNEPDSGLQGVRVLIAEDDAGVRDVAIRLFRALGASVRACGNPQEALAALQSDAEFDLLFSDISMGAGMGGDELAAIAQARRPGLAVLLTTGYAKDSLDAASARSLRWPVLGKPYRRSQLAAAARRALEAMGPGDSSRGSGE